MTIQACFFLFLATAGGCAFAQQDDGGDREDVEACRVVAEKINQSHKLGIRREGLARFATWRAACAERPPTGKGNVTVLCQGKRPTGKGEQDVFFWEKSDGGKLRTGYFLCES